MNPLSNNRPSSFHEKAPEEPKDLNHETLNKYMTNCRDAMKEAAEEIENYKNTIREMAETISLQSEAMETQNKEVEKANAYISRANVRDTTEAGTFSDVIKKTFQAVMSLFFF